MIVVSDTSAITALIQIGRVDLLASLYGELFVPQAVWVELLRTHPSLPPFIRRQSAMNKAEIARLLIELDLGEAEAIVLSKEIGADRLLIDESLGRQVASREGLSVIGLLGVLLEAKRRAGLPSVRKTTEELERVAGFRVAQSVKAVIYRAAGEE